METLALASILELEVRDTILVVGDKDTTQEMDKDTTLEVEDKGTILVEDKDTILEVVEVRATILEVIPATL